MNKYLYLKLTILIASSFLINVNPLTAQIEIADNTLKVAALTDEEFYFGFAEGDEITFSFEELKGKPLKEVEIIELPSSSKFMDFKTKKIENKTLTINSTGIYKFRFSNSSMGRRICKFNIKRTPASEETKAFNSNVYWETIYDTSYTTIQEKYLVSRDTVIHEITNQIAKVHSATNANGNRTSFNFTMPKNTISWAYYVGVNQEGQKALEDATKQFAESSLSHLDKIPGYGPLASIALGGASLITQLQKGEDVDYYIVDHNNVNLFLGGHEFYYIKKGKVVNDASRMTTSLSGSFHFCLNNDNSITGIQVAVKITAVSVNDTWGYRPIQKMNIKAHKEPYLKLN